MDISFDNDSSKRARLRRELRNPSVLTILLIVIVVCVVLIGPFTPGWVSTTQKSLADIAKTKEINKASMSSISAVIPSQISPWLANQANTMINAEGPLDWKVVSFRTGPCNGDNLSQLPPGKYSDSIGTACVELDGIQQAYSGKCIRAADCNIPEVAKEEILAAIDQVWEAFSDAGFVLPYDLIEEGSP
jgi:hypothetical protein